MQCDQKRERDSKGLLFWYQKDWAGRFVKRNFELFHFTLFFFFFYIVFLVNVLTNTSIIQQSHNKRPDEIPFNNENNLNLNLISSFLSFDFDFIFFLNKIKILMRRRKSKSRRTSLSSNPDTNQSNVNRFSCNSIGYISTLFDLRNPCDWNEWNFIRWCRFLASLSTMCIIIICRMTF